MSQQIRFCRSFDGTRIAWTSTGTGPPIVRSPHWLTHLEYEWESPLWRPWIDEMSRSYTYLRMDERACGLSDWDVKDISFETWVRDFEAVIDAAGLELLDRHPYLTDALPERRVVVVRVGRLQELHPGGAHR
jgi:pimeloyl-ACP methyl ester carboxylesterase